MKPTPVPVDDPDMPPAETEQQRVPSVAVLVRNGLMLQHIRKRHPELWARVPTRPAHDVDHRLRPQAQNHTHRSDS